MGTQSGINRRLAINVTDQLCRRFWSRVDKGEPEQCWPWKAAMRNGYGAIKHEGRVLSSHRLAFTLTYGAPPEELVVGHKCDNRQCCNPDHLEAITPGNNNRDARERICFHSNLGEDNCNATLTEADVRRIIAERALTGYGCRRIADRLSLPKSAVSKVIDGTTWKHITGGRLTAAKAVPA